MTTLYDARGNLYLVASPDELREAGVALPPDAAEAARRAGDWTEVAIDAFCRVAAPAGGKPFLSDGLLVGPFESAPPFSVLIVNTDGSLAERSGNGLTIFTTALRDTGLARSGEQLRLIVHTGRSAALPTDVEPAWRETTHGVWVSMGAPAYGPGAVGATPGMHVPATLNGVSCSKVGVLAVLDAEWATSQFVSVGNPHCVTFLAEEALLPGWDALNAEPLRAALTRIADVGSPLAPAGLNLQWAARTGPNRLAARVFERGEGPTRSSGTSAVAVASAALRLGLVEGPEIEVAMPGGTAPIIGQMVDGRLSMRLFGVAVPTSR